MHTEELESALARLQNAVANERSNSYRLKLWSRFIRLRDGNRCVICHSKRNLSAHHVLRKSLLVEARFQTGNGITLCKRCHREPHGVFNRKPDLNLPMDAQGGEKLELLTAFLNHLLHDAKERQMLRDDFYYFSDQVLAKFKMLQSFDHQVDFPGCRLEQAFLIWRQTPRAMLNAVLQANGVTLPADFIEPAGTFGVIWYDGESQGPDLLLSLDPNEFFL